MTFGELMFSYRSAKGLSQYALADALGVKRNTIAQYESGRIDPKLTVALSISRNLGFKLDSVEVKGEATPALKSAMQGMQESTSTVSLHRGAKNNNMDNM